MYFLRKLSETHTHSFICQGKNSFQILTFPIFVFTNKVLCSEGVRLRVTDRQTDTVEEDKCQGNSNKAFK